MITEVNSRQKATLFPLVAAKIDFSMDVLVSSNLLLAWQIPWKIRSRLIEDTFRIFYQVSLRVRTLSVSFRSSWGAKMYAYDSKETF